MLNMGDVSVSGCRGVRFKVNRSTPRTVISSAGWLRFLATCVLFFSFTQLIFSQKGVVTINGQAFPYYVSESGDTVILASLDSFSVTSPRNFKDREEYYKYQKYKRYASQVYPYAVEAVRVFRKVEEETKDMRNRKRKKYTNSLHDELKANFEEPLKNLTKTQGMILIEMIERELNQPVYNVVRELKSGFAASYWGTLGRIYGYNLKEGYIRGKDPLLDNVLDDLDPKFGDN